ncbi:MAG: hypothetical protein M3Y57_11535 [Acidobacteriota bacterium]|nr:hypothetical protein [Acidobacteriota bacterium]
MKVLFDQNVPRPLERFLVGHDVKRAAVGWAELKNGGLLAAAENAGFDVLLSGDKTIRYEQNMTGRKIALVYMSDNHWPVVKHHVAAISQAIEQVAPGEVRAVYCGTFIPRKFQTPSEPPV